MSSEGRAPAQPGSRLCALAPGPAETSRPKGFSWEGSPRLQLLQPPLGTYNTKRQEEKVFRGRPAVRGGQSAPWTAPPGRGTALEQWGVTTGHV